MQPVTMRSRTRVRPLLPLLWTLLAAGAAAAEDPATRNGFRLAPSAVPADEILAGGPPRDGIPALDAPATAPAARASWDDDALVLGVAVSGEARAYPLAILTWHELVNDRVGGVPILVSYCPLCGTGIVFDRRIDGRTLRFGVSGLLYRSDLLMFDRETESLWSQIAAKAVTGPLIGRRLRLLRARIDTWGAWRSDHPEGRILSRDTGHLRDYGRSPYAGYESSEALRFPAPLDRRYHPKLPTVGLRVPGEGARAYPASELVRSGAAVEEHFLGRPVRVAYDASRQVFRVTAPDDVEVIEGFWFAWSAFHPETTVYRAPRD